jgi:predicted transposase YbfD/YdcC
MFVTERRIAVVAAPIRKPASVSAPASPSRRLVTPVPEPTVVCELPSLYEYLGRVADPRKARGRRHPLVAILALLCLAMLSGIHGYLPAAEWGAALEPAELQALGFTRRKPPVASTLYEVLRVLSWEALETELRAWAAAVQAALPGAPGTPRAGFQGDPQGLAIDGKTLRGSWKRGAEIAHLLAVVGHRTAVTLAQVGVARKRGELSLVRPLLQQLVLEGLVLTFDAQFTQADIAATIGERGGDYVMRVKGNQPTLLADVQALLSRENYDPQRRRVAYNHDLAHGRADERRLVTHVLAPGDLDWPGAKQDFVVISRRADRGSHRKPGSGPTPPTLFYGVTSLGPETASPERLLRLFRGHWTVENRAFWIRDVVFREDESSVVTANIVSVIASLRVAVLNLIRGQGSPRVKRTIRKFNANRKAALQAIGCL